MSTPTSVVTLRPNQTFAVDEILKAFDNGSKLVMLSAPVGTGKSIDSAELSRRLKERNQRVTVTTPQVSLVAQYAADKNVRAINPDTLVLVGRDNYECLRDHIQHQPIIHSVAEATCYELTDGGSIAKDENGKDIPCHYRRWWSKDPNVLPQCEFYADRARAEMAQTFVTTLAYFTLGTVPYDPDKPGPVPGWLYGRLSGRPVIIIDEAHDVESEVIRYLTSTWNDLSYSNGAYEVTFRDWCDTELAKESIDKENLPDETTATLVESLANALAPIPKSVLKSDSPKDRKFSEQLKLDLLRLDKVADDIRSGIPWVVKYRRGEVRKHPTPILTLQPVVAGPYIRRILWDRVDRAVVMSGSFLDPATDKTDMGAGHLPGYLIKLPSEFPPENAPILRIPVARFTAKTRETALPVILNALWHILDIEKGKRGVIHTQSFKNVEAIAESAPEEFKDRLILHRSGANISRAELIQSFQTDSAPGDVLASPSVTKGLDLPGDRGEFVVWIKAPFMDLQDERVSKRKAMADGQKWYTKQALMETLQGMGRVVRTKTDKAHRWVLDESHCNLLAWNHRMLPDYVLASIRAGDELTADGALYRRLLTPYPGAVQVRIDPPHAQPVTPVDGEY